MDSIIWIGISPDLLIGGLDTLSLLKSDHYLEFKIEAGNYGTKEAVKLEIENDATSDDFSNNEDIKNIALAMPKVEEDIKPKVKHKRMKDQNKMDGSIKCEKCKKLFRFHKSLERHMKMGNCVEKGENYIRPNLAPKLCPECGKTIKGTKSLKDHIKAIHLKIKIFKHQCSQCGRGFVKSSHLTSHIESVHQQETFYCEYCPRNFHASAYLRDHIKRQHNNTAVECYNCKKKFVQRKNLDIHIQTGICGEEHKETLREKKIKRRNKIRVSCPYCQMNVRKCGFKKHVDNVHKKGSGGSPSGRTKVCGYCDFQTGLNKKLHTHIKIMHPTVLLPNEVETS